MATSGSVNYTVNRTDIFNGALRLLGIYGVDETPATADYDYCDLILNSLVKHWQYTGVSTWKTNQAIIFPQQNQTSYTLGSNNTPGGDHATLSAVLTTSSAAASSGASTVTLTTVTGMSVNDNIGVLLDNGSRHWTTITNINSGTKVVTLNNTLTSASASGNSVYTYTTKLNRPLKILSLRRMVDGENAEIPLTALSNQEYFDLPTQRSDTSTGTPTQYYYQPVIGNGLLYLWQTPENADLHLRATILQSFDDFDVAANNPDFPQEWNLALIYNLAIMIAPTYGKTEKSKMIEPMALKLENDVRTYDHDMGSYKFYADDINMAK